MPKSMMRGDENLAQEKGARYRKGLAERMCGYFSNYAEDGAPSFGKFARSQGITAEDLAALRECADFDRAYRTCSEIRRDYLIDKALCRRADPSFVKFVLESEARAERAAEDEVESELQVRVKII